MNKPSPGLQAWLDHPTSITERLKRHTTHVQLEVLSHEWSNPIDIWDDYILNQPSLCLRREIITWASNHACWYARTLIPKSTYEANIFLFGQLQTKSLGELIWHNSAIQRASMQQFCINKNQPEHDILKKIGHDTAETLWGRLSVFNIDVDTKPFNFYLLEIFLPDLKHYE